MSSARRIALVIVPALSALLVCSVAEPRGNTLHTRTIYLVRHGAYVPDPKADSELGPGLTALGIAQARLIGARLRGLPVQFDSMTSSTMTRARETAAVMHETLSDTPLKPESPLLSECTPHARRAFEHRTNQELETCARRLGAAFATYFVPSRAEESSDVIVAHGNVIRYFVMRALRVDTRAWTGMSVAHTSLTIIRVRPDGSMSVLAVGDVGHLPPNLQSWGRSSDAQLVVPGKEPSSRPAAALPRA